MKIVCPHCNYARNVNPALIPLQAKTVICPRCHQKFQIDRDELSFDRQSLAQDDVRPISTKPEENAFTETSGVPAFGVSPAVHIERSFDDIPWESQGQGYLAGFLKTAKMVLFQPGVFFAGMPVKGGLMTPLTFAVLAGSIGFCFSVFWPLFWVIVKGGPGLGDLTVSLLGVSVKYFAPLSMYRTGGLLLILILIPVMIAAGLFLYALFTHFLLIVVWGNKNGFEATFRVISYISAAYLFNIVPILGGIVGSVWIIVLEIVGLSQAHGVGILRVLFAVLFLPFILFALIIIAIVGAVGLITGLWLS
ncbi:MAG: zinc-ribbon domain-containing protein [Deltaproteobacteria bacterium]|nr:zinc-ribbon domain-containing protein [Deltaproteobacteria bacterium]